MSMGFPSRRRFIKQTTGAVALGFLNRWPTDRLRAEPASILGGPEEALLRELAIVAVDAARGAGAAFADVRVSTGRAFGATCRFDRRESAEPWMLTPGLTMTVGYCVRAVVGGTWGVATGFDITRDAVAKVAQVAVSRARDSLRRRPLDLKLAPAPTRKDVRWATQIEEDPFVVPVGEQADIQLAALSEVARMADVSVAQVGFGWQRSDRVFASSEGALQIQRIELAFPSASVSTSIVADSDGRRTYLTEPVSKLKSGGYGYEAVSRVNMREALRQTAEFAVERAKAFRPPITAEVGRYDLVCTASAVAQLLTSTLGEAVNAERVLGYNTNHSGTSFAAPPSEALGEMQVGSPMLTIRADRSQPHGATTVGWDDEGVPPEEFTIVEGGVLQAYQTNRQTGAELGAWFRSRGELVRSYGCASGAGTQRPTIQLPNLTMEPGAQDVSIDQLIAETHRGFLIERALGRPDQQMLNGQFSATAREIRDGKLGERVRNLAFQFVTPAFWQGMDAIGGRASAESVLQRTDYANSTDGIQLRFATVSAVPARFRQVNVLNTGATG